MQQLPKGFVIDPSRIAMLEDVVSMECYERLDGTLLRRALDGVSFTVAAGQRFALLGNDAWDLKLLTETIRAVLIEQPANTRAHCGRVVTACSAAA